MKKKILLIAALVGAFAMTTGTNVQASEVNDTVKVIDNARRVVITERQANTKVEVVGNEADSTYRYTYTNRTVGDGKVVTEQKEDNVKDWSLNYPFRNNDGDLNGKNHHWDAFMSGLYFGWGGTNVNSSTPEFKGVMKCEFEIGILNLLGIAYNYRNNRISLGFGIESRYYHMKDFFLVKDLDDAVHIDNFPPTATKCKSEIRAFSLQFPLMYRLSLPKRWGIWAGGVMNVNTGLNLHNEYRIEDTEFDITTRNLKRRPITFDVMAGLSWECFGAYVRYRPQSVFKDGFGPKFNVISGGVMLFF